MRIERWNPERDGPLTEEALRRKFETRGYQVQRYVYRPGTAFLEHRHRVDKLDGVLSGRFRMTLGDHSVVLEAGDCIAVPNGTPHSAEVVGNEPVISLDASRKPA